MDWISLGSILPPLNPQWQSLGLGWVDSSNSLFKIAFNVSTGADNKRIKARIVLRQILEFDNGETARGETKTFYPNFYGEEATCFLAPLSFPGKFKWELTRYYPFRSSYIKEPNYSVEVFAARL